MPIAALRLTPVRCAFGGTGVSAPGHYSVMLYVDVAAARDVGGLRVSAIEVLQRSGVAAAHAVLPIELRVSLPGRDQDHNFITATFSGALRAGDALRLVASAELTPMGSGRSEDFRYRATFVGEDSHEDPMTLAVEGPLEASWATAGPAIPR
jgi:hypothetical protein